MTIQRNPGEDLVSFYNRRLRANGVDDREWYYDGPNMRMRSKVPAQSKMDLGR